MTDSILIKELSAKTGREFEINFKAQALGGNFKLSYFHGKYFVYVHRHPATTKL